MSRMRGFGRTAKPDGGEVEVESSQVLTWYCHVCGKRRPDAKIAVASHDIHYASGAVVRQNVLYCDDNPDCLREAAFSTQDAIAARKLEDALVPFFDATSKVANERNSWRRLAFVSIALLLGPAIADAVAWAIGALA